MIRTLPCLMPLYGDGLRRPSISPRCRLFLNDFLGRPAGDAGLRIRRGNFLRGEVIDAEQVQRIYPTVDTKGLKGGAIWHDAFMPDPAEGSRCHPPEGVFERCDSSELHGSGELLKNGNAAVGSRPSIGKRRRVRISVARDPSTPPVPGVKASPIVSAPTVPICSGDPLPGMLSSTGNQPVISFGGQTERSGRADLFHPSMEGEDAGRHRTRALFRERGCPRALGRATGQLYLENLNMSLPGLEATGTDILQIFSGFLPVTNDGGTTLTTREVIFDHVGDGGPQGLYSVAGISSPPRGRWQRKRCP